MLMSINKLVSRWRGPLSLEDGNELIGWVGSRARPQAVPFVRLFGRPSRQPRLSRPLTLPAGNDKKRPTISSVVPQINVVLGETLFFFISSSETISPQLFELIFIKFHLNCKKFQENISKMHHFVAKFFNSDVLKYIFQFCCKENNS